MTSVHPPVGRKRAIELVKADALPIWLGSPEPRMAIVQQGGRFRIRELVLDETDAPGNLGTPTGKIYAEATTRDELVDLMRTMAWPEHW